MIRQRNDLMSKVPAESALPDVNINGTSVRVADLDDYIYELESRNKCDITDSKMTRSEDDIYVQLEQKEKDLILAAELGKALLERNEELTRANERITEEYSHKLEVNIDFN